MELGIISYEYDLKKVWNHEEKDFTPWLANNLNILGSTLGVNLELVETEHSVGAFYLDILAKDIDTGDFIAIENQLENTDHTHLGQILTYASGVDAKIIVWISKNVRDEHRKAIDWLNQITGEERSFFAIQIQLIKIDDSKPAPYFKVISSPNDWEKTIKNKGEGQVSEKAENYKEFFTQLVERVNIAMPGFTNAQKISYDAWKAFPAGISGMRFTIGYRSNERFTCELYIDDGDKESNERKFDFLKEYKDEIEAKLGKLSWEKLELKKACRVAIYRDIADNETLLNWSVDMLMKFRDVFKDYIGN